MGFGMAWMRVRDGEERVSGSGGNYEMEREVENPYTFEDAASPKTNSYKNAIQHAEYADCSSPLSPKSTDPPQNPSITPTMSFSRLLIGSLAEKNHNSTRRWHQITAYGLKTCLKV